MRNLILALIEALKAMLGKLPSEQKKKYNPEPVNFRNLRILQAAQKELGVKEIKNGRNKRIEEYHAYASVDNDEYMRQEIPWCASFTAFIKETVGIGSTNSRLAKSYLKWGVSTKKNPLPGDTVIFNRGGWKGHVAQFLMQSSGYIWVIGGNQNNAVTVARYSKSRLEDIRRSSLHRKLNEEDLERLNALAKEILKKNRVHVGGSQA